MTDNPFAKYGPQITPAAEPDTAAPVAAPAAENPFAKYGPKLAPSPAITPSPAEAAQAAGGFAPGTGQRGGTSVEQVRQQYGPGMGHVRQAQIERQLGQRSPAALSETLAKRRELKGAGISLEGAPAGTRAAASFAFNPEEGIKLALENSFSELGYSPEDLNIKKRRIQGEDFIVYTDPRTGQRQAWNPPGLSLADVASLAGEATVLTPEALLALGGGAAGTLAGPGTATVGAIGGGATGAATGEFIRLLAGQQMGLNPNMDGADMAISAAKQAGLSALGGGAVAGFLRLAKRMLGNMEKGLDDVTLQKLDEAIARHEELAQEVEARTGQEFPATSGQILERSDVIQSEQRHALEPTGRELRDILQQQEAAIRELETGIEPPQSFLSEEKLGEAIQRRLAAGPERGIRTAGARTQAASEAAEEAQQSLAALASPQDQAASDARRIMEGTRTRVGQTLDGAYDALARAIPEDLDVDIAPVVQYLQRQAGRRNEELFRSLAPDVSPLLRDVLELHTRSPLMQERLSQSAIPYEAFWNSLKTVKSQVRALQEKAASVNGLNVQEANSLEVLKGLRNAMERQRASSLQRYPELAAANDEITTGYRLYKDILDKQVAENFLKLKSDGTYAVQDKDMVRNILANRQVTKNLLDAAQEFPEMRPAMDSLRRGARQEYLDFVINKNTGALNPRRHDEFMKATGRGPAMRELFGDEVVDFQSARQLAQRWADAEIVQKQATDRLNKAFGMKMQRFDASEVVDKLWQPKKQESLRRLRRMLPPDLWREFQSAARAKDVKKMTGWSNDLQERVPQLNKLSDYINEHAGVIEQVHGGQYLRDLRLVERALRTAAVRQPKVPTEFTAGRFVPEQKAGALLHGTRALVGMFTTAGRTLTAGLRLSEKTASEALVHALANPMVLRRLILRRNKLMEVEGNRKVQVLSNIYGPTAYEAIFGGTAGED